jgi:transcriptional regulator with XRE-family HTH domain
LRAALEESFLNIDLTVAELCRAVGRLLQHARLERRWKPVDVERAQGPSYKTVQAIERGDVGTIESLDKYATALGLTIVDVFASALSTRETPLSPEAAQIVRIFARTTVAGRTALLAMANALPIADATTGTPPIPGGAATLPAPDRSQPDPKAVTRRTPR